MAFVVLVQFDEEPGAVAFAEDLIEARNVNVQVGRPAPYEVAMVKTED